MRVLSIRLYAHCLSIPILFPKYPNKFMVTETFVVLEYLTASDNKINIIPSGLFKNWPNLRQFIITKNKLRTLDISIFEGRDDAVVVSLSGNPWWCDSALTWLCDLHLMDHKI